MGLKLDILVINWNKANMTLELLSQLDKAYATANSPSGVRVSLLDNGSDVPIRIATEFDIPIELTGSEVNLGYSGGMHLLLRSTDAPLIWLLNNDCTVDSNVLLDLIKLFENDSPFQEVVAFPAVVNPDRSIQSRNCTWSSILGWRTGSYRPETQLFGDKFVCPLISRTIISDLGLFPPEFHTYAEDFDACYAINKAGYRAKRLDGIVIGHQLSSSRPSSPATHQEFLLRGGVNYIASVALNYTGFSRYLNIPVLVGKVWVFDLLVRNLQIVKTPGAIRTWFSVPYRAMQLARSLSPLSLQRSAHWELSDRDVSKIGK